MPTKSFPTLTDLHCLMNHARAVIQDMRWHFERGARPELAAAMAITALDSWRLAVMPPKSRDPLERQKLAMNEALVVAIHHYSDPAVIEVFGADQAAARRELFSQILMQLTGP